MKESTSTSDAEAEAAVPAAGSSAAPELRTFLFADVRGYTRFTQERGDEAAVRLVRKFEALTRESVDRRDGRVIETRGDEVLAVFPSARQALRAAVDMQARFQSETAADPSLPLHVGIGIEAGEAIPLNGGYRGEALNLAARLCNLAGPGEILTTEGVVYLGRQVQGLSYADRGDVPIKGFGDRVKVIRVVPDAAAQPGSGATSSSAAPVGHGEPSMPIGGFLGALPSGDLVGRQAEWERIVASMEDVMQGNGRLVLLSGEPGVGKTRLAQEVTLKARHWGFLVATGRCYESEQNLPYVPFLEALLTLYEQCHPSVRAEVPRRWPYLGRLLPDQVGFIPAPAEGQEDQFLLFRAVTGFIEAVAQTQPVAIVLDDLHWADEASLRLLQHLARYTRRYRLLLSGTYRDVDVHRRHPLETVLLDLAREHLVDEVEVRALDLSATRALMAEIMGEKEDLDELAALVYQRSDGNPFFIEEMLHAMIERGDIYRENGRWAGRAVSEMEIPKSIRSIIGQRLSRLDEGSQEILREASVLGQEFSVDDLLALATVISSRNVGTRDGTGPPTGSTEDDVESALEGALRIGLVREVSDTDYAFNHALTQQALFAELSPLRRRRLHLAAGRALERLPERERDRRAGELAWHFLEGNDWEQALKYSMRAGEQAEALFANHEAEHQYRTARELAHDLGDDRQEAAALERLAGVLIVNAQYDRALRFLEEAASLYREFGDREGEACTVAQMGRAHFLQSTPEEGIARLQPLIDTMEAEGGASLGLAALWAALAELYSDIGEYEKQLAAADRALELVPADTEPVRQRLRLGAEVTRSGALLRLGQRGVALQVMEDLIPRAEAAGDLDNLARALGTAATYYAHHGQLDKDRLYLERMLAVSERRDDRGQIVLALMALSTNAFELGDWKAAADYLGRAEAILRPLGNTRLAIWPLVSRAWLSLRQGDLPAAERQAQEALSLLGGASDAPWRRNVQRILAESALLAGESKGAAEHLASGQQESGWQRDPGFLHTLAWVHLTLGNVDEARSLAERSVTLARVRKRQPELVSALTLSGAATAAAGATADAAALLEEALAEARETPLPFEEARAHYEMGLLYVARGERETAQQHFTRAETIFERLDAQIDRQRVQAAMANLDRA